jgi:carboxymethylenebutenolidase
MLNEERRPPRAAEPRNPGRRDFVAASSALTVAAATGGVRAAAPGVVEQDVTITTPDGHCDAAYFYPAKGHPAKGRYPGVLIWTDVFGLRPVYREFGRRLADSGYAVLVPNPFYRTARAPVFSDVHAFNFQSDVDRAKLPPLTGPLMAAGAAERDAQAYVAWLDAQPQIDTNKKLGTQGYCMGGPLVLKTAAVAAARVGAGASFHGGGLVTDKPDSPHLLATQIKARLLIAIAASDDAREPDAKNALRQAFPPPDEVEVYAGDQHGWCVPDMPLQASGEPIYNKPDAERAWSQLLALYGATLA